MLNNIICKKKHFFLHMNDLYYIKINNIIKKTSDIFMYLIMYKGKVYCNTSMPHKGKNRYITFLKY